MIRRTAFAYLDGLNPAPINFRDDHIVAVIGVQYIAYSAHFAGMSEEIPGDRLIRAVLEFDAGQIGEILDRHAAVDGRHAIDERGVRCGLAILGFRQIVFVVDVADQLLGHILKRHNAVRAAVLVNDHGEMNTTFAQ